MSAPFVCADDKQPSDPLFGKKLFTLINCMFSLHLSICNLSYSISHFSFVGRILLLIVPIPSHCLPFTFVLKYSRIMRKPAFLQMRK